MNAERYASRSPKRTLGSSDTRSRTDTSFRTTGMDRAFTSLASTSSGCTLRVRIGWQDLEIEMASTETLEGALRDLHGETRDAR